MIKASGPKRLKSLKNKYLPLVLIVAASFFGAVGKAQTGFPSTDSLHRYNNRYVKNTPVDAFANLRLNTLLHGIIAWIDTVAVSGGGGGGSTTTLGIDTLYSLNDSTLRYRKNGVSYDLHLNSLYGVRNGLTKYGGVIGFGGTLVEPTGINQAGNQMTFHDGIFVHGTGDYITQSSDYSIVDSRSNAFNVYQQIGPKFSVINSQTGTTTWVDLEAGNASTQSVIRLTPELISINNTGGNVVIPNLIDSAQEKVLYIDDATGKITKGNASGTGGGSSGRFGVAGEDYIATTDRDFDQAGNGITFHNGIFVHGTGDYSNQLTAYNRLENNSALFTSNLWDGANAAASLQVNVGNPTTGIVNMQAYTGANYSDVTIGGSPHNGIYLSPYSGNLFIPALIDSAQSYSLHYNPTTFKVTYALNGGGGGGGGAGGLSLNTANGLTNRNDSTAILGGSLDQQTTIDGGASYTTNFTSSRTIGTSTLTAANTSSGAALTTTASSGTAISGTSASGVGASITSGSEPLIVTKTTAVTNTMSIISDFRHTTSGTAANGFGGYLALRLEDAAGALNPASYWAARWQSAAAKSSAVDLYNFKSGIAQRVLTIDSVGKLIDTTYGYGKHTGTPTYYLGADASGNFIEVDPADVVGGGGGAVTTDATLTGNGTTTPLGVNTSVIATTDYVDAQAAAGGTTLTNWVNVLTLPGVSANAVAGSTVGSSPTGTDCSAAVAAAISTAPSGATIFFPRSGTGYRFTQPITYPSTKKLHIIVEGALYFGTSNGIIMDGYMQTLDATKGNIYGTNQTAGTPNYSSQTNTGVWVRSCESCRADIGEVMGFKYGNQVGGYATGTATVQGAQFNRITFAYLRRNSVGIYIHPSGGTTNSNGNWANANGFWGGKITGDSGVVFRPDVTQGDRFNGNNFYQVGFENGGSTTIQMKCAIYLTFAVNNSFFGCRFEPNPITRKFVATTNVDNTNFFGQSYFQWDWLDAPGNNIHIDGPIYDGTSGLSVGTEARGYRYSSTNTFYNQRVLVRGTTRSVSGIANVPSNIDVRYTNETSVLVTTATYTVLPGLDLVRVSYSAGVAAITLPSATANPDRVITIKNTNGSNAVAVTGQSNIAASGVGVYRSAGGSWIKIN